MNQHYAAGKRTIRIWPQHYAITKGYGVESGGKCRKCKCDLKRYPVYEGQLCGECLDGGRTALQYFI